MKKNTKPEESYWSDDYIIGIPEVDKQHKGFLDMLDNAHNQLDSKHYENLEGIIQGLEDYFIHHFAFEENLLKEAGSSDIEEHMDKHRAFIKKVEQLKVEYSYLNPTLTAKIVEFMRKWFVSHILQYDSNYKDVVLHYLKNKSEEL